ncbi:hypothetical protein BJ944DRAFT_258427 [Cunninghamella echinulata]|nr:hypothetical protein BJ944DRAFT_258427 [Cunninghamella echinulata]
MAYYNNNHEQGNYYSPGSTPHNDSYPMSSVHQQQHAVAYDPYENYHAQSHNQGYQHLNEGYNNNVHVYEPSMQKKRSCLDYICCGCCTCCPRWIRYCSCVILLIIIALGIVIGVLAALFKKPSINFNGLSGEPQFSLVGSTANIAFNMNFTVNNPNVESVTFSNIKAVAYYPNIAGYDLTKTPIGGGNKSDVPIGSYSVSTIIFPFTLNIDATNPTTFPIVNDLLTKCGITGGTKEQIKINYDITPTVKIIGIPISFTISSSSSFDCPDSATSGVQDVLGPLASLVPSGINLPTGVPTGIPTGGIPSGITSLIPSGVVP